MGRLELLLGSHQNFVTDFYWRVFRLFTLRHFREKDVDRIKIPIDVFRLCIAKASRKIRGNDPIRVGYARPQSS